MSDTAYLFSQFHSLVLHEIARYLPIDVLHNLIEVIQPSQHLLSVLKDAMYLCVKKKDQYYSIIIPPNRPTNIGRPLLDIQTNIHLLSDANLGRMFWFINLLPGGGERDKAINRNVPEALELLNYMENGAAESEGFTLRVLRGYVFNRDDHFYCLSVYLEHEFKRRAPERF